MPAVNNDGTHVANYRTRQNDLDRTDLTVREIDGTEVTLQPSGTLAAWSPDGRWLAFNQVFDGSSAERVFFVFDTETGITREVDGVAYQGGGDFRVPSEWAPTSEYFRHYGGRAASPLPGRSSVEVTSHAWWVGSTNVRMALLTDGGYFGPVRLQVQDLDSGQTRELPLGEGLTGAGQGVTPFSPDGRSIAVISNLATPGVPAGTRVLSIDGRQIAKVAGEFAAWSSNGEYLMVRGANACPGLTIFRTADWQTIHCLREQQGSSIQAEFSPQGSKLAYLQSQPRTGPGQGVSRNAVAILDLATGQEQGVGDFVGCIQWSPDGKWLVAGTVCQGP